MAERRTFTPEFKTQVVLEELTAVKDKAEICREYRLRPQVFSRWRPEFVERAPEIFATERSRGDEQKRIAELERMIGRLTMELEVRAFGNYHSWLSKSHLEVKADDNGAAEPFLRPD